MKAVLLLLLGTTSLLAGTRTYTLRLEKQASGRTSYTVLSDGAPTRFSLVDTSSAVPPVETHTVRIFRGNDSGPPTEMANSEYRIFDERDGSRSVAAMSYRKFFDTEETKGFGSLVWGLLFADPRVREIRCDLDFDNYRELKEALGPRPATDESFNDVVMEHSHFGRLMGAQGFRLDAKKTRFDSARDSVHVQFVRAAARPEGGFLRWCVDSLSYWLGGGK